jgi:predicted MPP superfamily phosphohydrolase
MIYGRYVYGKVVQGSMTAITTSGVGSWWPPQRIGTRSEIVVIEIM